MKVSVQFFKPSGKWYTEESVEIPEDTQAWDFHKFLPADRLTSLIAIALETPWGFPSMRAAVEEQTEGWDVEPRLVHVMIGKDGERLADYESFGQSAERLTRAAETAARLGHEEEARRLSRCAAVLAEKVLEESK